MGGKGFRRVVRSLGVIPMELMLLILGFGGSMSALLGRLRLKLGVISGLGELF